MSFHLSEEDVQDNKAITFPFTSPEKDPDKLHWELQTTEIFVRIENNLTGCINTASSFNLVVNPLPITFEVEDYQHQSFSLKSLYILLLNPY